MVGIMGFLLFLFFHKTDDALEEGPLNRLNVRVTRIWWMEAAQHPLV